MNNFKDLFDRAKVEMCFDYINQELVIRSHGEQPLTNEEKKEIKNLCFSMGIRSCRFYEEKEK